VPRGRVVEKILGGMGRVRSTFIEAKSRRLIGLGVVDVTLVADIFGVGFFERFFNTSEVLAKEV